MALSTNAILVFGFEISDELDFLEEDDRLYGDLEGLIMREAGIPPWEDTPSFAMEARREALQKATEAYPVEIVIHCSEEHPMCILAVPGARFTASRGYPEVIDPSKLIVDAERIGKAKVWAAEHGVGWKEPTWILCSYKG